MQKPHDSVPIVSESIVDLWECIPTNWPKLKYEEELAKDLTEKFRQYEKETGVQIRRILDCGCGTGNPSIGLAKEGFDIVAVDKDPRMVERFKKNCSEAGVNIRVEELDWRDLRTFLQKGGPLFDAVMCRGNGLIYVESWDRSQFSTHAAMDAIGSSLESMASALKSGGILYVDMPSKCELEERERHLEVLGRRETDETIVVGYWLPRYDIERRIRRLEVTRVEHSKNTLEPIRILRYTFVGYLLGQEELQDLIRASGCKKVEKKQIRGEYLYDSFWGYKG